MISKKHFYVMLTVDGFHFVLFLLRLTVSLLMIPHGWSKLMKFEETSQQFFSLWGLSPAISLAMTIFAELLCAAFLALGLFTRIAGLVLAFTMFVAAFLVHFAKGDGIAGMEHALLYLIPFLIVMVWGPGKYSLDRFIFTS